MGFDLEISGQEVSYKWFLGLTGKGSWGYRIRQGKKLGQAHGELWCYNGFLELFQVGCGVEFIYPNTEQSLDTGALERGMPLGNVPLFS